MWSWLTLALSERHTWKTCCISLCSRAWASTKRYLRHWTTRSVTHVCVQRQSFLQWASLTTNVIRGGLRSHTATEVLTPSVWTPSVCKRLALKKNTCWWETENKKTYDYYTCCSSYAIFFLKVYKEGKNLAKRISHSASYECDQEKKEIKRRVHCLTEWTNDSTTST